MKKLFALLLALVMALSLVACGEKKDDTGDKTDDSNPSTDMELTQATDLVIATGGTSGAWYPIGVSIADTLTNVDNNLFDTLTHGSFLSCFSFSLHRSLSMRDCMASHGRAFRKTAGGIFISASCWRN